ncbi:electron transport complex subunit RsxB [Acidihalobacter prosperus]|uniref:Rnf electron transport complex subunit B n=1 Tax=Acidihalobacter prosperus TaxID=160660 RepID=A0A1A6C6R3_9GAMM|nr:electron transport complex subunit RsxB [Acidihalobacter prosperus]OBS10235.1 hypothetical protein Thpro_021285 [Acidihalobacter prosperus]
MPPTAAILSGLLLTGLMLTGSILAFRLAARRRAAARAPLAERLDALLPQTQCGQCGYPGCRPYADAIAAGAADINQCPPGGEAGVRALARLLDRAPKPLDPTHGVTKPRAVARIDEAACIGCTLCIQACPVDAIVGAAKRMHTVITAECTGCELCLPPCPVDCIALLPAPPDAWRWPHAVSPHRQARQRAERARQRYQARQRRLAAERLAREARLARKRLPPAPAAVAEDPRQTAIRAAVERVRAKKAAIRAAARPTPPQDQD